MLSSKKKEKDVTRTRLHFRLDSKDRIDFFFECNDSLIDGEPTFFLMLLGLDALKAQAEENLSMLESQKTDIQSRAIQTLDVTTDKFDLRITGTPSAEDLVTGVTAIIHSLLGIFKERHNMSIEDLESAHDGFSTDVPPGYIKIVANFYLSIKEGHKKEDLHVI